MFTLRNDRVAALLGVVALAGGLACHGGGAEVGVDAGTVTGAVSSTGGSSLGSLPSGGADDGPTPTTGAMPASTGGTGDEPGWSSSGAGPSSGGVPGCGDGVVDPGEACDDGILGNDDSRYCTEDCELNVCGDGKLLVGWELCDEGVGNSDAYGSVCAAGCVPGARCGDHKLQPEFETCDLGADNGGMKGDDQEILCDPSCRALRLRGFVTAAVFTGDLGGFFGADLKCRDAAAAAGLAEPERFHALLSSGQVDAKQRFEQVAAALPFVAVTGKKFADSFAALLADGPLAEGVAVTETGAVLYQRYVASNTAPGGTSFSPDQHCQGWTSADPAYSARVGLNAVSTDAPEWAAWKDTQAWLGVASFSCNKEVFHLYCLEI